jgi:hypothetical protein
MSNLIFKKVVLNQSSATDESVMQLVRGELNSSRSFSSFKNNIGYASGNTHILGGFIDDELVCINVFMPMKFMCEKKHLTGYQSGFSATSGNQRGKGHWTRLMKFSENFLAEQGASFIFGYPNPVSYPLFLKKLAYQSMNMHNVILARVPFWPKRYLNLLGTSSDLSRHTCILKPDLADNFAWKQGESGESSVETYKFGKSFAWGKIRTTKKLGFRISFLEIGGMELSSHADLEELLKTVFTKAGVLFCYISLNEENEYFPLFKRSREKLSPVIIKSLSNFEVNKIKLNFFGGMRDTF